MAKEIKSQVTSRKSQVRYRRRLGVAGLSLACCLFSSSCVKPSYKNTFIIVGTNLEVISSHPRAAAIVLEEFKRLTAVFNSYDQDSELSRLNASFATSYKVSNEMIEVLQLSKHLFEISSGAFDVSYGVLYDFWKSLMQDERITDFPEPIIIAGLKKQCGMQYLDINTKEQTVTIKKKGLKIDLAAIAKGYMVDKAVARLKAEGIRDVLINAGGDIYCLGENYSKPWRVGVKDPFSTKKIVERYNLVNEAIATSGSYEQFFIYGSKSYSHLIDPRTGYPSQGRIVSVSVIDSSCARADGLATALFVMGPEEIRKFRLENSERGEIFVIMDDGRYRF